MANGQFLNNLANFACKVGFQIKKHSPEILMGLGAAGTVTSAVLACKATLKVDEVAKESKEKIAKIHTASETGVTEAGETYTQEDAKKDLTIVYTRTALDIAKQYAPSVLLGAASLACFFGSHKILHGRNIALATAYAAVDKGFKQYRGRVVERFGEKLDRELKYNLKTKEIEETIVDEKGKEKKVKRTVDNMVPADFKPEDYSIFARLYDIGCIGWTKDPEQNKYFLLQQQNWANDLLKHRHYVTVNDVYEMLGFPKTALGQSHGWVYDEKNPRGDNYIDFGIFDIHKPGSRDFVNGYESAIILDFNPDGNILVSLNGKGILERI